MQQIFVAFLIIFMAWILTGPGLWDVSESGKSNSSDDASGGLGILLALPVGIIALIGGILYLIARAIGWLIKAAVELLPYLGKGVQRLVQWTVNAIAEILKAVKATVTAVYSLVKKLIKAGWKLLSGLFKTAKVTGRGLSAGSGLLQRIARTTGNFISKLMSVTSKGLRWLQNSVQWLIRSIAKLPRTGWKAIAALAAAAGLTSKPVRALLKAVGKVVRNVFLQLAKILKPLSSALFRVLGKIVRLLFAGLETVLRQLKPLAKLIWKPIQTLATISLKKLSGLLRLVGRQGLLTMKKLLKMSLKFFRQISVLFGKLLRPFISLKPIAALFRTLSRVGAQVGRLALQFFKRATVGLYRVLKAVLQLLKSGGLVLRFTGRSIYQNLKKIPLYKGLRGFIVTSKTFVVRVLQLSRKTFLAFARTVPLLWAWIRLTSRLLKKFSSVTQKIARVTVRRLQKTYTYLYRRIEELDASTYEQQKKERALSQAKTTRRTKNTSERSNGSSRHANNDTFTREDVNTTKKAATIESADYTKQSTDTDRTMARNTKTDESQKITQSGATRGSLHKNRFRPQTLAEASPVFLQRINLLSDVEKPVQSNHIHGDDIIARMRVIGWQIREKLEEQHWI